MITDPSQIKPGQIRCGEHTDYGAITLLIQDDIGGLEVRSIHVKYCDLVMTSFHVLVFNLKKGVLEYGHPMTESYQIRQKCQKWISLSSSSTSFNIPVLVWSASVMGRQMTIPSPFTQNRN